LALQPLFGGGLRGVDYWSVLHLSVAEAVELLEWVCNRHEREVKAAFGRKGT